jgi:hypothetical protein
VAKGGKSVRKGEEVEVVMSVVMGIWEHVFNSTRVRIGGFEGVKD